MLDKNARALVEHSDEVISSISRTLYYNMLKCDDTPIGKFKDAYFFQTVVRAWLSERTNVRLKTDTGFPQEYGPVSGVNWPRMETCGNPIANRFVNLVKADSDSKGDEFDVAYAVKIIELLFGDDGELRCRNSGEMNAEEFDYWLSGFNSKQP